MWLSLLLLPLVANGQESCASDLEQCSSPTERDAASPLEHFDPDSLQKNLETVIGNIFDGTDLDADNYLDVDETDHFRLELETRTRLDLGVLDNNGDGFVSFEEVRESLSRVLVPLFQQYMQELNGAEVVEPVKEEPIFNRNGVVIRW